MTSSRSPYRWPIREEGRSADADDSLPYKGQFEQAEAKWGARPGQSGKRTTWPRPLRGAVAGQAHDAAAIWHAKELLVVTSPIDGIIGMGRSISAISYKPVPGARPRPRPTSLGFSIRSKRWRSMATTTSRLRKASQGRQQPGLPSNWNSHVKSPDSSTRIYRGERPAGSRRVVIFVGQEYTPPIRVNPWRWRYAGSDWTTSRTPSATTLSSCRSAVCKGRSRLTRSALTFSSSNQPSWTGSSLRTAAVHQCATVTSAGWSTARTCLCGSTESITTSARWSASGGS